MMDDLLADFLAETREMLAASESELVAWEAAPSDIARIDTIFRLVHTIKGNCGFFDFPRLELLSHAAEGVLATVRSGERLPDARLVDAILAIIDRIAVLVDMIDNGDDTNGGGHDDDERLISALEQAGPGSVELTGGDDGGDDRKVPAATQLPAAVRSIRIPVDLLDMVMRNVSDLVLARNDLALRLRTLGAGERSARSNDRTRDDALGRSFDHVSTILDTVHEAVTRMRMQPISQLFAPLPRLVRDLSAEMGKEVEVDITGGDVELDREMIESIRDPLTHLLRNAIDHGIEDADARAAAGKARHGLLSLSAWQSGNRITVTIGDDGNGLDEDAIGATAVAEGVVERDTLRAMTRDEILQLIFEPGLSTRAEATAISGRGVGMDVVRTNLNHIGGTIRTISTPGEGTTFALEIPLTLSMIAGLVVRAGGQTFAVPRTYVEEIVQDHTLSGATSALEILQLGDRQFVTFRERRLPVIDLAAVLGVASETRAVDPLFMIIRLAGGETFALAVDAVDGHQELVVKSLPPAIMQTGLYAGTTLSSAGEPILLLDIPSIAAQNDLAHPVHIRKADMNDSSGDDASPEPANVGVPVILCTATDGRRVAIRMDHVRHIETVRPDLIDRHGSGDRAMIDGAILPVIGLHHDDAGAAGRAAGSIPVVRLHDRGRTVLLAVEAVIDSDLLVGPVTPAPALPLSEGIAIIGDRMTIVLDIAALFARVDSSAYASHAAIGAAKDAS